MALVGLLRLGWIAEFLSAPIITGFLAGVAVIIVVHQLPDLLGLPRRAAATIHRLGVVAGNLGAHQRMGAGHRRCGVRRGGRLRNASTAGFPARSSG